MTALKKSLLIIFLILFCDQLLKIWIKTHMIIGQEHHIFGNWFILHFTENDGMAFGIELGGKYGKIFLSLFRICAVVVIGWYLYSLTKIKSANGLIICISMIFAGALGNIIDCAFYGLIFNHSNYQIASFFPEKGGYAPFLFGKVVDMFYFPIIKGRFPDWFPFWDSKHFIFFRPVFNIADASITIGVANIIIFQKRFFKKI